MANRPTRRCRPARTLASVMLALAVAGEVLAATPDAGAAASTDVQLIADAGIDSVAEGGESLYLEVVLNGNETQRIAHFSRSEGHLRTGAETLRQLGFRLPADAAPTIDLADLSGVSWQYDASRQRMLITAPERLLDQDRAVLNAPAASIPQPQASTGALLNYDVYGTRDDESNTGLSSFTEFRMFGRFGVLSSTWLSRVTDSPGGDSHADSRAPRHDLEPFVRGFDDRVARRRCDHRQRVVVARDTFWRHPAATRLRTAARSHHVSDSAVPRAGDGAFDRGSLHQRPAPLQRRHAGRSVPARHRADRQRRRRRAGRHHRRARPTDHLRFSVLHNEPVVAAGSQRLFARPRLRAQELRPELVFLCQRSVGKRDLSPWHDRLADARGARRSDFRPDQCRRRRRDAARYRRRAHGVVCAQHRPGPRRIAGRTRLQLAQFLAQPRGRQPAQLRRIPRRRFAVRSAAGQAHRPCVDRPHVRSDRQLRRELRRAHLSGPARIALRERVLFQVARHAPFAEPERQPESRKPQRSHARSWACR